MMKDPKLCCRIYPVVLILISAFLTLGFRFFTGGSFSFPENKDEVFLFFGTVLFVAFLPIGLFYYLVEKEKYRPKARQLALLGFLPALGYIVFLMI